MVTITNAMGSSTAAISILKPIHNVRIERNFSLIISTKVLTKIGRLLNIDLNWRSNIGFTSGQCNSTLTDGVWVAAFSIKDVSTNLITDSSNVRPMSETIMNKERLYARIIILSFFIFDRIRIDFRAGVDPCRSPLIVSGTLLQLCGCRFNESNAV